MAKKKISRKELLKKEDEFVSFSNRAYQYILAHSRQFQYAIISLAIILICIAGVSLYIRHINKKALAAYNSAYQSMVADADIREDAIQKSIEEIDRLLKDYGWTKFATLALPQLAYIKFGQGKYDEAISLYQKYLGKDKSNSIYRLMSYFGLSATYEAKKDYQTSIAYLKKIVDNENNLLREEAMFSLGRVYALTGNMKKSKDIFKEFVNQFKDSELVPLARANMAR